MPNKIQVQGVKTDATTADQLASTLKLDADVDKLDIQSISGTASLNGKLTDGLLKKAKLNLYFHWGFGHKDPDPKKNAEALAKFKLKLKKKGLDKEQIDSVVSLIDEEMAGVLSGEPMKAEGAYSAETSLVGGKPVDFLSDQRWPVHLPDVPLDLDLSIDVKDTSIDSVKLNADSAITADSFTLEATTIDGLEVDTDIELPFQQLEIDEIEAPALEIPSLALSGVSTSIDVDKLTSTDIPLDIDTKSGDVKLDLEILNWKPRWTRNITIPVFWWYIYIWMEYGFDLELDIDYRLLVKKFNSVIALKGLLFKGLKFTVRLVNVFASGIRSGALSIRKILAARTGETK